MNSTQMSAVPIDIGDCGVCGNALKTGENHAFTVCKHLFCISCLLKWHAHSVKPTCPMCRTVLYEPDPEPDPESEPEHESFANSQIFVTNQILRELDFDIRESVMHQHMMEIVRGHAIQCCNQSEIHCVFMGDVNLFIIPKHENDNYYQQIEVGRTTPNIHYMMMLSGTSNVADEFCRLRFGRIEGIHFDPMFPEIKWFAFRERISVVDEERGQCTTSWANEIIQVNLHEVMVLVQYIPRIRADV